MKRRFMATLLAAFFALTIFAGCSKSSGSSTRVRSEAANGDQGEYVYAMESGEAVYEAANGDIDLDYSMEGDGGSVDLSNSGTKADISKEMLVYRCNITIDTLDFEGAVSTLKQKVKEYRGLIEYEYQSDGVGESGQYVVNEEDKDYTYSATIRIPSEYYDSFTSSAEGLGILRSKNSSVDNVTTVYGTLKSELEIYEADYARYLEKYEETEDDAIALSIEKELRTLALTIADIKTQMSTIEGDVAYSYITISIHKVCEEEIVVEPEPEPVDDSFSARFKETAKESWESFLEFVQGIILFLVRSWWVLLIIGIIVFVIVFSIKRANKKRRIRNERYVAEREERERQRKALIEAEKQKKVEGETKAQDDKPKEEASDPDKV